MQNSQYALVLGGGGANGAYQIGVWKGLRELCIKPKAIIGSSVGALNGALMIQNDFQFALDLWKNLTLDQIINLPKELLSQGKFKISMKTLKVFQKFQNQFFENHGLDSTPLKNLIAKHINENKIRKSDVDFGIATYLLKELKPLEIYLEDIENNELLHYLLATASLPGFKPPTIKGKQMIDGGVYNNLPFNMAKERGYKNIILVDISGMGINRRPNVIGTTTTYIKNSNPLGLLLDFNPEKADEMIEMGYLDTLKIFEKISGIQYFIIPDKKIEKKLEHILFDEGIFYHYLPFFKDKQQNFNDSRIIYNIRKILPNEIKNYQNIVIALIECAAISLDIPKIKKYTLKEMLLIIKEKYNLLERKSKETKSGSLSSLFNSITQSFRNFSEKQDLKEIINQTALQYEKTLEVLFEIEDKKQNIKRLNNFFPYLSAAHIFFIILKEYFHKY